ncbi:MAG TPA: glutamate 5-kinase [Anaerolineae bacterium]
MYQRIVVKLGTSVLTGGTPHLDRAFMVEIARQCAGLHRAGCDVLICTSGAIAAGRERLGTPDLPQAVSTKQMLASVGQLRLMALYENFFDIYGVNVGQVLLTRADVKERGRFLNARDVLHALLEQRILPIVNENDAIATAEIKVGDNDNLSALVALLVDADLLLMLTDQEGLYTADPRSDPEARLIPEVHTIDRKLRELAGGSVSGLGVGGMLTKLQAADVARRAGADVIIAAGRTPDVLTRVAGGERLGTRFPALAPLEGRKRWIFAGRTPKGRLRVDAGAARALAKNGKSLLPAGILDVEGEFSRGDSVAIQGPKGDDIARGITRYSSAELGVIRGHHSDEIAGCLGYDYGPVAVHRNDLILV